MQGADIICNSLCEKIEDIVSTPLRVKAVKVVRSIVVEKVDETVQGLLRSLFPPTPREWVHSEMVGSVWDEVLQ